MVFSSELTFYWSPINMRCVVHNENFAYWLTACIAQPEWIDEGSTIVFICACLIDLFRCIFENVTSCVA